ncbi:MAG TPA: phosphoglycerate mutase family protein [Allosphingosinicella sp.]|jgi:phosphohistidine phosphatase SixA
MTMKAGFAAAALAALAACAMGDRPAPDPSFFVIRHLHKDVGQDPGLTAQGLECARRLATMLEGRGVTAVYVSTTRRARETGAPFAAAAGISAQEYAPADIAGLAARAQTEAGSVLIVGHSNTVPDIVERLGGTRPGPIDESRFGEVWQVARRGGTTATSRIPGC